MTALGFPSFFSCDDLNASSNVYSDSFLKKPLSNARLTVNPNQRCKDSASFSFRAIENTYQSRPNSSNSFLISSGEIERSNCWDHLFNPVESKPKSLALNWKEYKMPEMPVSLKRKRDEFETSDFSIEPSSDEMSICEIVNESKSTPPQPCKKSKSKPNKFAVRALKVLTTAIDDYQVLHINDKEIKFKVIPLLDANGVQVHGDFVELCTIAPNQPNLFAGYENTELLLKRYRKHQIEQHPTDLKQFMRNSIQQHDDLFEKDFPINPILNASSAIKDAIFIVPKVNHAFPIKWNNNTDFKSLDEISKWLLIQVKSMIQYAFTNKIPIGMKAANVRINDNNEVSLIDPMERTDLTFLDIIDSVIKSFANYNQEIADYLYPEDYVELTKRERISFCNYEIKV